MSKSSSIIVCSCGNSREQVGAFAAGWGMSLDYVWTCDECRKKRKLEESAELASRKKLSGSRGIYDSQGKLRDRFWLNKKLEVTRTEKKWHDDIRTRKILPNGQVARYKNGRRIA